MADQFTKLERSRIMLRIKSTNSAPELKIRKKLKKNGVNYSLKSTLPGRPDLIIPDVKLAIFVDGCFWHKCPRCYRPPKSNKKYWNPKINSNAIRDKRVTSKLKRARWAVLRIWEHEIQTNVDRSIKRIVDKISKLRNQLRRDL
ncbi:very short patch repair endonuclease [Candidatus Micrarchaeota archaeon]|nr:very short patch repair endonuclease [Candidatus Micrarchaeota archaeon]